MTPFRILAAIALLTVGVSATHAQSPPDSLSPLQIALACAPPPATSSGTPAGKLRVIGAQDSSPRSLFGQSDLLVISGGTEKGMQLGQQFFLRRRSSFGTAAGDRAPRLIRTAGWLRIVAANDVTAIATVEYGCDGILVGDYLEPFVVPVVPAGADRADTSGELDFTSLGRVLAGDEERLGGGTGEYMLIDRGEDQGVSPGARFAVYRDLRVGGLPLSAIGEVTVVSTGPTMAVVRINQARDAVQSGDWVVPRR
ncbi:MAG: hypothetical protein DMF92_06430 [Acidobacteria bacterium]|nr:MAG: hypothetical protein DMF92_06430 [Acidobacteriota bacterium]